MFKGIIFSRNDWINYPFDIVSGLTLELSQNYAVMRRETGQVEAANDFRTAMLGLMSDALPSIPDNQPFGGTLVAFTDKSWRAFHIEWATRLATPLEQRYQFTANETGEPIKDKFLEWLLGNLSVVQMDWEAEKMAALDSAKSENKL